MGQWRRFASSRPLSKAGLGTETHARPVHDRGSLTAERTTLAGREAALVADLAAEQARAAQEADKAGKAIAAFTTLAESFDALAAARSRPWWRRLVG